MPETIFPEIHAAPLSEVVVRVVREAIIEGRLAPGQLINQADLAKQLGVSRAPLREGLRQLETEGLVSHVPYRGTVVAPLTRRSVTELQSFRMVMETFAAKLMLTTVTPEDLDGLEKLVDDMARAADNGDVDELNRCDLAFHTRVVALSGHRLLMSVWENYVQRIRRALTLRNRANTDLHPLIEMHRELTAAFRAGDIAQVERCYETHGKDVPAMLSHLYVDEE
jgi:GntR family transcriptional regulator of gluconate operon